MFDILNITEPQARVLRAISYYESKTKEKGASQYNCVGKTSKKFQVANSTFNDQIRILQKELMVLKLAKIKKSQPFTITDLGQVAWLRHYPIEQNLEIIKKVFPNVFTLELNEITNNIENQTKEISNDRVIQMIFREALNQFHISHENENIPFVKFTVQETISISSYQELVETSYKRNYNIVHPGTKDIPGIKNFVNATNSFSPNYDNLIIKIPDRIEFLFYYILIQAVLDKSYMVLLIIRNWPIKIKDKELETTLAKQFQLAKNFTKKKKEIKKIVTSNKDIKGNIKNNLAQLEEYHNTEFEQFYKLFFK